MLQRVGRTDFSRGVPTWGVGMIASFTDGKRAHRAKAQWRGSQMARQLLGPQGKIARSGFRSGDNVDVWSQNGTKGVKGKDSQRGRSVMVNELYTRLLIGGV